MVVQIFVPPTRHMASIPTDVNYDDIVWLAGPRLLGILFNWSLLGLLTAQVYIYYLQFPRDRTYNKVLVYSLYLCDWAQTCSATYDAFQWFVYGWGNIAFLYRIWSTWLNVPIFGSLIGAAVQLTFARMIYLIGRSWILQALISTLAVLQFSGGMAVAYYTYTGPFEISRVDGLVGAVGVRLAGSAAADILIAVAMTYFLLRSREHAIGHTNNIITRLVRLTIETGTLTAVAAIADLVFFLTLHNGMHQISGVILGKLYSNTLLVLYNNRAAMSQSNLQAHTSQAPSLRFSPRRGLGTGTMELSNISSGFEPDISLRNPTKPSAYVPSNVDGDVVQEAVVNIRRDFKASSQEPYI